MLPLGKWHRDPSRCKNFGKFCDWAQIRDIYVSYISAIVKGNIIALYSPPNSMELFYLCKVLDFGIANENLIDKYNHVILKGNKYLKCQYFTKISEKKGKYFYKLLPDEIYAYPTEVMSPYVNLGVDSSLSINEYQWLSDSI